MSKTSDAMLERYRNARAAGKDPGVSDPCIDCGEGGEYTCRIRWCPARVYSTCPTCRSVVSEIRLDKGRVP